MEADDLALVADWLAAPHVARWWLAGSSVERELEDLRQSVRGDRPNQVLVVLESDQPIGWCQWYRCEDHPLWAAEVGAAPGDAGMDYAIGEHACTGRGLGTELVAVLVERVQAAVPGCGIVADPDERNLPSRRVLEKNGFGLIRVAVLPSEPTDDPVAIYRRPGVTVSP
jgi:aminoglycoside 6'-N-acetyltransferase